MPDAHALPLFVLAALVLLLTPGPAVLFIVTRSLQHGRAAGLLSTLGVFCGGLVHVLAAVLGLSILLASSALAFNAVRLLGAAYLIYLGWKSLRSPAQALAGAPAPAKSPARLFVDGFMVNLLNPKTAIFFLAFLPQFVDPRGGAPQAQLGALGFLFVGMGLCTDGLYALTAATVRARLVRNPAVLRHRHRVSAAMYFGLGAWAALTGRRAD
jgi:threonine/homoserine/homoserine lactone efflux protein